MQVTNFLTTTEFIENYEVALLYDFPDNLRTVHDSISGVFCVEIIRTPHDVTRREPSTCFAASWGSEEEQGPRVNS